MHELFLIKKKKTQRVRIRATVRRDWDQIIPQVRKSCGFYIAKKKNVLESSPSRAFSSSFHRHFIAGIYLNKRSFNVTRMVQTHTHTQFFLNAPFSSDLGRSADTAFISGFSGALNWSHKQTAGVGVYDNINEKLLWGPAGWWSRVKLPGLLHSIIVYLISASLLFGSTPGSPPPPPLMADSATAALNEIKRCKRAGLFVVNECWGSSFHICTTPATAFIF